MNPCWLRQCWAVLGRNSTHERPDSHWALRVRIGATSRSARSAPASVGTLVSEGPAFGSDSVGDGGAGLGFRHSGPRRAASLGDFVALLFVPIASPAASLRAARTPSRRTQRQFARRGSAALSRNGGPRLSRRSKRLGRPLVDCRLPMAGDRGATPLHTSRSPAYSTSSRRTPGASVCASRATRVDGGLGSNFMLHCCCTHVAESLLGMLVEATRRSSTGAHQILLLRMSTEIGPNFPEHSSRGTCGEHLFMP